MVLPSMEGHQSTENLLRGPNLFVNLLCILFRFWHNLVTVGADIEKMFQVPCLKVPKED